MWKRKGFLPKLGRPAGKRQNHDANLEVPAEQREAPTGRVAADQHIREIKRANGGDHDPSSTLVRNLEAACKVYESRDEQANSQEGF